MEAVEGVEGLESGTSDSEIGAGAFKIYSNHPPARPDETHAARIANKPSRGF